jgi:hypothetical protein
VLVLSLFLAVSLVSDPQPASPPPKKPLPACAAAAHRAFDFWVGEWEVTVGGKAAGKNTIERILEGCALRESWTGARGNRGTSLNWYEPADGKWHQLWLDDDGTVLRLAGGPRGDEMVLEGEAPGAGGKLERQRITWSPAGEGKVRQLWESSPDGKAWKTLFDGLYARRS